MSDRFANLRYCVIIPTYNNDRTLAATIDEVLKITQNLIVINDGSTDQTTQILKKYTQITVRQLEVNKGKGNALREGFKIARDLGYEFAITLDSDGQHFATDIPVFLDTLEESLNKDLLLIGARNMSQAGVPKKSSFGNRFSNFWFWVETGIRLEDTQSGFRLYPIKALKDVKLWTNKFEFEIEVIVKAAWKGIEVKNVPVRVHYDLKDRITHFRPFQDFTRISILNTWLVAMTFLYIKPRDLVRKLKKKGFKKFVKEDLIGSNDSPEKKSFSVALGVFIGLSPLWGFHTLAVLSLALLLKLNKVIAFAFSNVSIPPFIPIIIFASLKIGSLILGEQFVLSFSEIDPTMELMKYLKSYIVGSLVFGILMATLFGVGSYIFLSIIQRKKEVSNG